MFKLSKGILMKTSLRSLLAVVLIASLAACGSGASDPAVEQGCSKEDQRWINDIDWCHKQVAPIVDLTVTKGCSKADISWINDIDWCHKI